MEKTPGQACRKQTEQRTRGDKGCKHKHRVSQETQQEVIRKTRQGSQIKYDTHETGNYQNVGTSNTLMET